MTSTSTTKAILAILAAASLSATDITVCAAGCDYSNLQTALNATTNCSIDTVTVRAGETFNGSYSTPFRDGCGVVQLRTSRYAELPPLGTRVGPEHAPLMPTINANIVNSPALTFYAREANDMTAVDLGTNVMTLAAAIPDGLPFSCSTTPPPPMEAGVIYYSKYISPTTMQASILPGGPAIDLTGVGSTGSPSYDERPHCIEVQPRRNWRVTGIKFTMPSGTIMQNALIRIGNRESSPLSVPRNIWFDRSLVQGHGDMSADYPTGGIEFHGGNITISGNYISDIRCFSCEGKPLLGWNITGPVLIENNHANGGSIGLLVGGARSMIPGLQATDVVVDGNYFSKPGKEMYREGAGAPTGTCYYGGGSGEFYRNTSSSGTTCSLSGRCYTCQPDNTWAISTTEPYRADDFLQKNMLELKECNNCIVRGNVLVGQQASIDSQGNCILAVVGATAMPVMYMRNTAIVDNRCSSTWGGISTATYSTMDYQSYNLSVENNLVTGMGSPQLVAANGGTGDVIFQLRVPKWQGTMMQHNTFRPDASASVTSAQGLFVEDDKTGLPSYAIPAAYVENNIWWGGTAGTRTATGISTCNSTSDGWGVVFSNDGTKQVRNNAQFGTTTGLGGLNLCAASQNLVATSEAAVDFASDSSLNPTSPYSASCSSGCAFEGTDGSDLGVDVVRLNTAISGAQVGTAPFNVTIYPGSVGAIMSYTAPTTSACTIKLWNDIGRTSINADTNISGEQVDSRTGSVSQGTWRQVVLGVNTALTASTPYWFTVDCTGTTYVYPFRTLSAGSGTYNVTVQLPTASVSEYSSSADMSSPTVLSSSTAPVIPVPTGTVRYWRKTDGLISALIAR